MSALASEDFCNLLREVAAQRPRVGMIARVSNGKRRGALGKITWHGEDRFASRRYLDNAQLHFRDCQGTWGFRVRIQPEDGEPFFVAADKIIYCLPGAAT